MNGYRFRFKSFVHLAVTHQTSRSLLNRTVHVLSQPILLRIVRHGRFVTNTIRLEKIYELLTGTFTAVVGSQILQLLPSLGFKVGLELLLLGLQKIDEGHPARIYQ